MVLTKLERVEEGMEKEKPVSGELLRDGLN